MNRLQIMGPEGHRELTWEIERVEEQDPETMAVIAEAEQILADALRRGHVAFQVDSPDQPAKRIKEFDPTAPRTVIVPRIAGG
jgi:hypothetical protein